MQTAAQEYQKLADMSSRTACPRCDGFGFIHMSIDKHDRPPTLRCKKCIDCSVCETSGVTVGVVKCLRCSARGFYHNPNAPVAHAYTELVKCFDCLDCRDCLGFGVLDQKRIDELKEFHAQRKNAGHLSVRQSMMPGMLVFPPVLPDVAKTNMASNNTALPVPPISPESMHPHMLGILGLEINQEILDILKSLTAPQKQTHGKPSFLSLAKQTVDCPKCLGAGYKHDSSSKHDKKGNERCKHCSSCKACTGTGKVTGKRACMNCETRGFIHMSTEREHDVPKNLRCFFCKDCPVCKGLGVEPIPKPQRMTQPGMAIA
ncbi:hypothetical protein HDV03_005254 [Kappamyces sp. JEL0829]|nr:hypothetical protein HDV03_005254 [Kappamyces sp. JEL0829]